MVFWGSRGGPVNLEPTDASCVFFEDRLGDLTVSCLFSRSLCLAVAGVPLFVFFVTFLGGRGRQFELDPTEEMLVFWDTRVGVCFVVCVLFFSPDDRFGGCNKQRLSVSKGFFLLFFFFDFLGNNGTNEFVALYAIELTCVGSLFSLSCVSARVTVSTCESTRVFKFVLEIAATRSFFWGTTRLPLCV